MGLSFGIIDAPAHVVRATGDVPIIVNGRATTRGEHLQVQLDNEVEGLEPGGQIILSFFDPNLPKIIAHVESIDGQHLVCTPRVVKEVERRYYPRMYGGVQLRYRVLGADVDQQAVARAWLAGDPNIASEGRWLTPDEFMNFSVTGLAFDSIAGCQADDLLLMDMGLRRVGKNWRCTSRVIRVNPIPLDEQDPTILIGDRPVTDRIAVNFENIPDEAQSALVAMTLAIQEAMI